LFLEIKREISPIECETERVLKEKDSLIEEKTVGPEKETLRRCDKSLESQ
jgi:hypothetical protein